MLRTLMIAAAVPALLLTAAPAWSQARPHNVVIFVADGLRSHIVTPQTAPEMARIRAEGVDLTNSHSVYPTVTTVNASAIATGHRPGDTGNFGNTLFIGKPVTTTTLTPFAAVEDDEVLGGMNEAYNGNYLTETSLLAAARARGFSTAVIGKLGPAAIQDVTARKGETLVFDDDTGAGGLPLPADVKEAMKAAGLGTRAEDRGLNGYAGNYVLPGVHVANVQQQDWFAGVATRVVLPRFKAADKPFVLVFWSRDPDGTQHGNGDSLNAMTPGINGPTSLAAIRNADNDLKAIRETLKALGLDTTTDIVVTADHGFSTVARQSATSTSKGYTYPDVMPGSIPPGALAIDLAAALKLPLMDDTGQVIALADGFHPGHDSALIGKDGAHPDVAVAGNGSTALIYLPNDNARVLTAQVVSALQAQDYVAGVFVRDDLGTPAGTLSLSAIGMIGSAKTPVPAIVVSYRSFVVEGCVFKDPELCAADLTDSPYTEGQGTHGGMSRADTHNFMALIGPDFKAGFVNPAPVSNADLTPTLARVLGLDIAPGGKLGGRVMEEVLPGGAVPAFAAETLRSEVAPSGFVTVLNRQAVGDKLYIDAGGMPGRVVGLKP